MPVSQITSWAQTPFVRQVFCAMLVPLLLVSGMSFDLHVTHARGSEAEHTHVSRVVGPMVGEDHRHHHHGHDHDHGHDQAPESTPCVPQPEPCCCGGVPESTTVVRGVSHLNRSSRDFAKQLDDQMGVVVFAGWMSMPLPAVALDACDETLSPMPRSSLALRSTVLLI